MSKNDIKIHKDGYAIIYIYDRNKKLKARCKVDVDDIEKINPYKWCAKLRRKYLYVWSTTANCFIHNLIMGQKYIDHINRDPLDNRKSNLRPATFTEQNFNKGLQSNNTSGIKGVSLHNRTINGKVYRYWIVYFGRKWVGQSKSKREAIKIRREVEKKYNGII